jgi:FtsP/CotA-like multicopper oxidase with cupredoxin domain
LRYWSARSRRSIRRLSSRRLPWHRPAGTQGLKLAVARDTNPDPHIVEIDLTARIGAVEVAPGKVVQAWTYDGGIPGPLIRAQLGDRIIVHFVNQLPQPTTIHWHGVRVPIEMDGVPEVSQPEVKTADTFTYDLSYAMQDFTGITRT